MRGAHARGLPNGRWMAEYEAALPGQPRCRRSAGVFEERSQALEAAGQARQRVLDGDVVESTFTADTRVAEFYPFYLQTALLGRRTRADYKSVLDQYVLPTFGPMAFGQLGSPAYKRWRAKMIDERVPDTTIRKAKAAMSSLITAAAEEGCIKDNALRILKVRRGRRRTIRIMTVEQFDRLHSALDRDERRLYLELAIETGARPGELMALCPRQIDHETSGILINRAVAVPGKAWSLSGDRFDINDYPKTGEDRPVRVAPELMVRLAALVVAYDLGPDDIIFNPVVMGFRNRAAPAAQVALGETFEAPNGRTYRHGKNSGYTLGRCRCGMCKAAHALVARTARAASPRGHREPAVDIMAPESWRLAFHRARRAAGIDVYVSPRHLRHTHVSWRLDRGENVIDVMSDVGHSDMSVTKLYRVQTELAPRLRLVT